MIPKQPDKKVCTICMGEIEYEAQRGMENKLGLSEDLFSRVYWLKKGHKECDRKEEQRLNMSADERKASEKQREFVSRWDYNTRKLPSDFKSKTFDSYVCEEHNQKPLAYLKTWSPAVDRFGFFLMGTAGTGKTHLMTALLNRVREKSHEICLGDEVIGNSAVWFNFSELMDKMRTEMFNEKRKSETFDDVCSCRFLFLDDVATGAITDHQRNQFYLILEHRKNRKLPTIMSANLSGAEMKTSFHERVLSRIKECCIVFTIEGEDFRDGVMQANKFILENRMRGPGGAALSQTETP